jgi:GlpG protein
MSGIVYGLLGFVWIRGKLDPTVGYELPRQIIVMMMIWFFLGVFGIIPHIANWAHGIGLVVGMAAGFVTAGRWRDQGS